MTSLLITGGTGTIGRALAKDALQRGFERICIFSRDEFKQAQMRAELGDDSRLRFFLGDVRDQDRLRRALESIHFVVHAAALKRVEAGEYNPGEFAKTNFMGTLNLIEAAHDAAVRRIVGLSTDKALNPKNAYGASKLMMERILLAANNQSGAHGPSFAVTRFGNVAGSRGSVIDTWRELIKSGAKSLPITDRRCTRYWLSESSAVRIVWDAVHMMPVEPLIPVAPSFRVQDLAEAMQMPWHEVGLRPGESLHEQMSADDSSEHARRMTVEELRLALEEIQ
jgi:UDP-N-acetylglucosamine 4,6-dehydratase